jgi:hypothetical protein
MSSKWGTRNSMCDAYVLTLNPVVLWLENVRIYQITMVWKAIMVLKMV